jgi:hypothetical protein
MLDCERQESIECRLCGRAATYTPEESNVFTCLLSLLYERSHVPAVRETHLLAISACVLVISACMLVTNACVLAIIDGSLNKNARNAFDIDIYTILVQ